MPEFTMLCIVEIACLVFGIIILVTGRVPLSANKEVRGGPAYLAGLCLVAVFPLALGVGIIVGIQKAQQGQQIQLGQIDWSLILIDVGAILVGVVPALIICLATAKPKQRKRPRSLKQQDYDDYDPRADDDRPRRSRRVDDYDDDRYDDRPRRRDDLDDRAR